MYSILGSILGSPYFGKLPDDDKLRNDTEHIALLSKENVKIAVTAAVGAPEELQKPGLLLRNLN